jgi:DNA-binding LytR/AlgR family response regulator
MDTISCIVIDDEPLALQLMESYVKKTPFLELKGSFPSASSAFAFLGENPVNLLFCDIQMPNLSGMELSKMLPEDTKVIFTTAFSQYAIEGFKVHALDYLLKPISYDDFLTAAKHAFKVISPTTEGKGAAAPEPRSIFVKTEYRLQQIDLDNITFIEGFKDYVRIHLADGSDPVLSLMRMKNLEEELPSDRFVRVQKSYIVQLSKIEAIERSHIIIGKDRVPIGETYQEALFKALSGSSLLPK